MYVLVPSASAKQHCQQWVMCVCVCQANMGSGKSTNGGYGDCGALTPHRGGYGDHGDYDESTMTR